MNKANQSGRSMIEMLGVLAIIGVLSVAGIMGYSKAMSKYKSNQIMSGVTHMINNVKTLFLSQKNVSGLDTKLAHDAGVIPDEFTIPEGQSLDNLKAVVHSYGGTVEVVASTVKGESDTSPDATYYAIKINGLPREVAMDIATQVWGDDGDLVSINLNDGNTEGQGGSGNP